MATLAAIATRNAGTYASTRTPTIGQGKTVVATFTGMQTVDLTDPTFTIDYTVVTDDEQVLTEGHWTGGPPSPKTGLSSPPSDAIVWPFPAAHMVECRCTTSKRARWGVDVSIV